MLNKGFDFEKLKPQPPDSAAKKRTPAHAYRTAAKEQLGILHKRHNTKDESSKWQSV